MLGTDLCEVLKADHQVTGVDLEDFNIAEAGPTAEAVASMKPEAIFHLAAFTDVEICETQHSRAFECNAVGAMNIAGAARDAGAYLIYLSTDYVFNGKKSEPYTEEDETDPVNYYGLTKLHGEHYVEKLAPRHLVVRTSWLFGPNGRNFVDTIVKKASELKDTPDGGPLSVVNDQRGCPTYTGHLSEGLARLLKLGLEGTVHLAGSGDATWFELAGEAVRLAGIDCEVEPVLSEVYPTVAARPAYSVIASSVLKDTDVRPMPPWQEGLRDHLKRKGMLKESE
jgi:dTDP-4-dehydrorhamnose reductase